MEVQLRVKLVAAIAVVALLLLALAACSTGPAQTPAADIPDPVFPEFVYLSDMSLKAYRIAVRNGDLLRKLPCYCNCAISLGHRSLYDCFLNADGTFNDHASGCAVCDMEAADTATWKAEGKSVQQIRRLIDTTYGHYGEGTKTPLP
jgi:hypothetical protein